MDSTLSDLGAERAVLAGLFAHGLESYVEIMDHMYQLSKKILKRLITKSLLNKTHQMKNILKQNNNKIILKFSLFII